jgi:hypothetical protein
MIAPALVKKVTERRPPSVRNQQKASETGGKYVKQPSQFAKALEEKKTEQKQAL